MSKSERIRALEISVTRLEYDLRNIQEQLLDRCLAPHPVSSRCERTRNHGGKHYTNGQEWDGE